MRLSFCPTVANSSLWCILVYSTGELGGDKHGGCLKFLAGPKNEERLFHYHIISYFAPRSQPFRSIENLVSP